MLFSFFKNPRINNKLVKSNENKAILRYFKEFKFFIKFAKKQLNQYNLNDWAISFDHSQRRAGACFYNEKKLSFSIHFLRKASEEDIMDTLLHEIAHALVGPKNAHNKIWKNKALEIGCSGQVYHNFHFSQPKWIKSCSRGCWEQKSYRKNKNLICKFCKSKVIFKLNN